MVLRPEMGPHLTGPGQIRNFPYLTKEETKTALARQRRTVDTAYRKPRSPAQTVFLSKPVTTTGPCDTYYDYYG